MLGDGLILMVILKWYYHRHLLSLLHKHHNSRRAIQQIHSHFLVINIQQLALWNSIIKHYSLNALPQHALFLFNFLRNQSTPFSFDSFTFSYLMKACAVMNRTLVGKQLQCLTAKQGFHHHLHVQTAAVNVLADCGCLVEAKKVFDEMPHRNEVSWNVLITGFVKWGEVELARAVFDEMPVPEKNVISWTGLIDGYTRMKRFHEALMLFRRMVVEEGIRPTEVTLLAVFPSIWNAGCLEFCQMIHAYGEKNGLKALDVRVMNCLVDAYARSGCIESARRSFEEIVEERRSLVSWTSMISGFAMHGMAREASECFRRMERRGVQPNAVTFLSLLNACSHGGLVEEGVEFYRKMVEEYGIAAEMKHGGTVIDMLGRAGRVEEAEKMALGMGGGVVLLRTVLGACSVHGKVEIGERVSRKIMEEYGHAHAHGADYVLLSNILSATARFADSERVRRKMDQLNAYKLPGITFSNIN